MTIEEYGHVMSSSSDISTWIQIPAVRHLRADMYFFELMAICPLKLVLDQV